MSRPRNYQIPSVGEVYDKFVERFPLAIKHGWTLQCLDCDVYDIYYVLPPKDTPIYDWTTYVPRSVEWAGMTINIPQTFWDDDLLVNHGN